MSEQALPARMERFPYKSMERRSSQLSPLSSDYSSGQELSQTSPLEKSESSRMSCTCCPYGKHQDGVYQNEVTVTNGTSNHTSPPIGDTLKHRQTSRTYKMHSSVSNPGETAYSSGTSRQLFSMDSQLSELSSPGSQVSPMSSASTLPSQRSRNLITKKTTTITSSNILPQTGENESLTISPEAIRQIKDHADRSNEMIRELQEQLKIIPQLQHRIKSLKEDKQILSHQLKSKSGISTMRSIGVGDFDVDEDHVIIERIKQTVTQEPTKPPMRSVGVGVYDVNTPIYSQAEVLHTVAEHVQKIREKEIHSWIKEAENTLEARKASTRSFGVGDKDIRDEENRLIKEREMRTILIGQQDKPSQRNVGMQVKPGMRDVCIGHSVQDTRPSTRTCGVNVDISDIIQEMAKQEEQAGGLSRQQQQQNSWTFQKHVIQRKFVEAMTTGKQEDLVNFITGLLKRSVRSVGTTAKPSTMECSTTTQFRTHDKGVGDDVTDVIVKPFVHMKDAFSTAKPATRTQPTWTDLLLTCNAATNTQPQQHLVERGVNTSPPPKETSQQSEVTNTVTTRHIVPSPVMSKSSFYHDKSQITKELPAQPVSVLAGMNKTITETTVTEHRSTNTKPDLSLTYHSHLDKKVSPQPSSVDLDITLPQRLSAEEKVSRREQELHEITRAPVEEHHRTEMYMMLHGRAGPLSPVIVNMLPKADSAKITSSTHALLANRSSLPPADLSTNSLTSESRKHVKVRSRSLSGDSRSQLNDRQFAYLSPTSSSTKTVICEEKPYTSVRETTETKESGGTLKSERTIERTFSSTSKKLPSLSDFDYFGANYSGSKPRGHADRMQGYGSSMTYSSTGENVNDERNKTELHGNPLKSRYTIEEMSSGLTSSSGTQSSQSHSTRSLLRDKSSPRNKKNGVKFADDASQKSKIDSELSAACTVLREHLATRSKSVTAQTSEARSILQEKWFDIACGRLSSEDDINYLIKYISEEHSDLLLEYVLNMTDGNGNTALHYAVSNINYEVMRALLQTGVVNANIQNKAGYTPVMLAALCDARSEVDRNALRLLLLNADVNMTAAQAGQTALMLAVSHGRAEMVNLLLESNSDVNIQDIDGSTALMCATEHNYIDIVQTLLDHPDINVLLAEQDGSTALDIALEKGHEEIAEMLKNAEDCAKGLKPAKERRSASRAIPIIPKGSNSYRASSMTSSRSYSSKFV
ncbi:KN motif and ankyrin repeat domain-containing protein 2-like isoform X2 [Watersipora subatra]